MFFRCVPGSYGTAIACDELIDLFLAAPTSMPVDNRRRKEYAQHLFAGFDMQRQRPHALTIGHRRRRLVTISRPRDAHGSHALPGQESRGQQPAIIRVAQSSHKLNAARHTIHPHHVKQSVVERRIRRNLDATADMP